MAHHIRLLQERGATAEASVPGFGKTYVAAFVARQMGYPMVVCCPKVVIPHWKAAAEAAGAPLRIVSNYEQHKLGNTGTGSWAVSNRVWRWNLEKPSLLVMDEAHVCKNRTSQNAKLVVAAKRQGIPTMVMSATLAQDPTDLYATGYLLGLHSGEYYDWLGWQSRFGVVRDGFGMTFSPRSDPTALTRLNAELFPLRGHRKTYDEIPGFPEATTDVRAVETHDLLSGLTYEAWENACMLTLSQADGTTAVAARLRARQQAELAKVPALISLARDFMSSGLSVPIFLNFRASIREVAAALQAKVIDGEHGDESYRTEAIADFQSDKAHALVLQIGAGGTGISLHDVRGERPRHSLISPPENARDMIQALGRNRRVGQMSPAFSTIVTLAGSVEERVRVAVRKKASQIETINDGDLDGFVYFSRSS